VTPKRKLEAPHRRLEDTPPRIVEKTAVVGYRLTAAVLRFVPPPISRTVIAGASQLAYVLWPAKRRYSSANFAHVLHLPPDHPRVHRMALRAYKAYARYVVELMRLPSRPETERSAALVGTGIETMIDTWRESGRAIIVVAGHIGNNEAVAAAIAHRGLPANVVADDSAYPEIFEILREERESFGVHVIPWRNLRELFTVLRRKELVALLVDWGYRFDGVPVQLFGSWTALPAGPATLAAKTGALILPLAVRRTPGGTFHVDSPGAFGVESSDPASIQRATQRIADALEVAVAAAPEQWYSFKPVWPADPAEAAELERRAAAMLAGEALPVDAATPAGTPPPAAEGGRADATTSGAPGASSTT
jgi:KDO2-lipid IV(A) lauroyltransferase